MEDKKWKCKKKPTLKDFLMMANQNEQLHDFIKGHLIIESLIVQLIDIKLEHPEKFNTFRLSFPDKISLCLSLSLLTDDLADFLFELNTIRNRFAHNLGYKIDYNSAYDLIKKAGEAGVEFTDNLDIDENLAKEVYEDNPESIIKVLLDNTAYEIATLIMDNGGEYNLG